MLFSVYVCSVYRYKISEIRKITLLFGLYLVSYVFCAWSLTYKLITRKALGQRRLLPKILPKLRDWDFCDFGKFFVR